MKIKCQSIKMWLYFMCVVNVISTLTDGRYGSTNVCECVSKLINMCATSPCMRPCACLRAWMLHTCADILCVLYMNLYSVPTVPQLNGSLELIGSCELMSSFAVRTSAGSLDGTELETSIWPKGQQVSVLYSVLECSKWHLRFWTLRTKSDPAHVHYF